VPSLHRAGTHESIFPDVGAPAARRRQPQLLEDEMNDKGSSVATSIAMGKDGIALLRDLAVFTLAVLLIAYPARLNHILTEAGFEEGSLVGFKWKTKLVDSDAALKDAQVTINDLKAQLDKTTKLLADAQAKLNDPGQKTAFAQLQQENSALQVATSRVKTSVESTIAANAPLVRNAQTFLTGSAWGVVFGGDTALDKAKYESDIVGPKLGLRNTAVYFRQGFYRSVAVAADQAEAQDMLSKARARRADAYVVRMQSWCPDVVDKDGYRQCAGS
jgi:hypothetical protein